MNTRNRNTESDYKLERGVNQNLQQHNLYIHSSDIGEDIDKRDYMVSNDKIESVGWKPNYSLDDGIQEIIHSYEIIKMKANANV